MRCQRKSGFQESRRERVAQINETVEVGFKIRGAFFFVPGIFNRGIRAYFSAIGKKSVAFNKAKFHAQLSALFENIFDSMGIMPSKIGYSFMVGF